MTDLKVLISREQIVRRVEELGAEITRDFAGKSVMFVGVLNHASATVINIGSTIWVMDPAVQTVANTVGMPDYVLDAVRSMQGVKYAVPLYSGGGLAKLSDGTYQSVNVIGLDDTSLLGRPELVEGKIEDIYA